MQGIEIASRGRPKSKNELLVFDRKIKTAEKQNLIFGRKRKRKTLPIFGQKRKSSWTMLWLDMPIGIARYCNGSL